MKARLQSKVPHCEPTTDQVSVADDGEVVLGAHGLGLDPVEVAGEADEPVVVLRVAVRLPVG